MKIVVLDGYAANPDDLSWEPLKEWGKLTVYDRTSAEDLIKRTQDADMVLTNKCRLKEEELRQLPRLKYIGELATGYNNIDIEYAHRHGIVVSNIPSYSTESVVQMTFAHIFNITNQVSHYASEVRAGRWSRNPDFCYWDTPLRELAGRTLGIVGLGHIGMRVAQVAHCMGMDVFALTSKEKDQLPVGVQKTTLEGLLGVSDILTLHCPLSPDTYHLINEERLAMMHEGSVLINTSRGALVDENAVADALASGHLLAYGADVMSKEPPRADNPLLSQARAYLTPHIAWATFEARQRLMKIAVENVKAFVEGHPQNVI
ncbi:MAG: D-2-hydroxyacid dehydrogenase [Prevotella sp.]